MKGVDSAGHVLLMVDAGGCRWCGIHEATTKGQGISRVILNQVYKVKQQVFDLVNKLRDTGCTLLGTVYIGE